MDWLAANWQWVALFTSLYVISRQLERIEAELVARRVDERGEDTPDRPTGRPEARQLSP